jgi:hypothetical protein
MESQLDVSDALGSCGSAIYTPPTACLEAIEIIRRPNPLSLAKNARSPSDLSHKQGANNHGVGALSLAYWRWSIAPGASR